jgi:hypothetical protein
MMQKISANRFLFMMLFLGFISIAWNLGYNSPHYDEVRSIFMGRSVLMGEYCYSCKQYAGTVLVQPVLAALGDYYGGIYGARIISVFFGLGLTAVVCGIASQLFNGRFGLLSAALFLFSGNVRYLAKLATSDIVGAFFLGLAFFLMLLSEKQISSVRINLYLLSGAFFLLAALVIKYILLIFVPPLVGYVLFRHRFMQALLYFLLPFFAGCLLYGFYVLSPVWSILWYDVLSLFTYSKVSLRVLTNWTYRWVAIPYMLGVFGVLHGGKEGRIAMFLLLLSLPMLLLHLFTGIELSVSRNVVFSFIFLSPAAALGVDRLGEIFSANSSDVWVKRFFISIIIIILLIFGIQEQRWLENQYPDTSHVVQFLQEKGFNGMQVAVDTDYGCSVYKYALERTSPLSDFLSIDELEKKHALAESYRGADFMILDDYHCKSSLRDKVLRYLQKGYFLMEDFAIPVSWGTTHIKIFKRREML